MRRVDHFAVEYNRAFARRIEAGDGAQQRRLPATRTADHGDDFTRRDFERNAAKSANVARIGFRDAIETEHGAS
jgi:hypothetical protein